MSHRIKGKSVYGKIVFTLSRLGVYTTRCLLSIPRWDDC